MKRLLLVAIALCLSCALFAYGAMEQAQMAQTREFTDSLGRIVTIPTNIERVAPSGNVAQVQLYTIANDLMVGNASAYSANAARYLVKDNIDLPLFGTFYGKKANLNKEALIVADPQLVIDIGEIKGSKEEMAKDLDALQAQINIPVVFIESYLENTPSSYRMLGDLLNREAEAKKLAKFAEDAISTAKTKKAQITEPTKVYYSTAVDGLDAIGQGSFHAEVLDLVGAQNVTPKGPSKGANLISAETLLTYDPEVILLAEVNAYKSFTTDAVFSSLPAVKNGKVSLLPVAPYPWIDTPPSVNRLIGIYYLGSTLYPELYSDIDLKGKIKEFFSLFYKYDLKESEISELINR